MTVRGHKHFYNPLFLKKNSALLLQFSVLHDNSQVWRLDIFLSWWGFFRHLVMLE